VKILLVASEMSPYAKTGGLADVVGALPRHLAEAGHDVRVVLPLYDKIDTRKLQLRTVIEHHDIRLGSHVYPIKVLAQPGPATVYFVHCPQLYGRGSIYTSDADEHRRYLALDFAAFAICQHLRFAPDILHCNDWQTALMPMFLKAFYPKDPLFARTRSLLTIHNLNYQGMFGAGVLPDLNLVGQSHRLHQDQLKEGRINFLLHGILYADGVSTVSPTYAREIQAPEHGVGLDPFLRARSSTVIGILNGVDYDEWSPERDRHIPHRYDAQDLSGKELDKQALLARLGLPYQPGVPVLGIVSRLASQKGFKLVDEVMPGLLLRHGFQLVVLGSGEPALVDVFHRLQKQFPRQVCFYKGFSEPLAHLIEAGSDMFLMPSRYEPCGLNQMYSLRYGTPPIVHKTGGLADTVERWNPRAGTGTGFLFERHDAAGLTWAIESALAAYLDKPGWRRLQQNGMAKDFSWTAQRKVYEMVYDKLRSA
jgi:starch synthase